MTDPVATEPIRFVIVTGLSGAGKSYAIKCLEDLGYFCVDNLPTTLIPTFAELCANSSRGIHAIALGVDVREGEYLANMVETIQELRARRHHVDVLFLEASDETLVRRYRETRRVHPRIKGEDVATVMMDMGGRTTDRDDSTVPTIVPVTRQNSVSGANHSQLARSGK